MTLRAAVRGEAHEPARPSEGAAETSVAKPLPAGSSGSVGSFTHRDMPELADNTEAQAPIIIGDCPGCKLKRHGGKKDVNHTCGRQRSKPVVPATQRTSRSGTSSIVQTPPRLPVPSLPASTPPSRKPKRARELPSAVASSGSGRTEDTAPGCQTWRAVLDATTDTSPESASAEGGWPQDEPGRRPPIRRRDYSEEELAADLRQRREAHAAGTGSESDLEFSFDVAGGEDDDALFGFTADFYVTCEEKRKAKQRRLRLEAGVRSSDESEAYNSEVQAVSNSRGCISFSRTPMF